MLVCAVGSRWDLLEHPVCDIIVWHPQVGRGEDATGERWAQGLIRECYTFHSLKIKFSTGRRADIVMDIKLVNVKLKA